MRKFFLLTTFFATAPAVFCFVLIFFLFVSFHGNPGQNAHSGNKVAYAALPTNQNVLSDSVTSSEAKVEIVRQFFARYKSPLEPHAQFVVDKAEEYNLDYRLLPAIAMQESNLCKKSRPEAFNCWGFGIYGDKYLHFDNYEHAIDTISRTLSVKYKDKHGLVTPEEIQKMYTPSSNGSWAFGVHFFMEEME